MTPFFLYNGVTTPPFTEKGKSLLMTIVQALILWNQYLQQQIVWLLKFICKYIPLRQMAQDDPESPDYQKFSTDPPPKMVYHRHEWDWQALQSLYLQRDGKEIKPVQRRKSCDIPEDATCPSCNAPHIFLYRNNGKGGQLLCKICQTRFAPEENRFQKQYTLKCPFCSHALSKVKSRKFFNIYKCVNMKCSFYLHNLGKVDQQHLEVPYGKNEYKLHYIYREFVVDFFKMDLRSLPKGSFSLKFNKNNAYIMSLCLTFHVNLQLSLRKTAQALKDLYGIELSHQTVARYARTAAAVIKPFVDNHPYEAGSTLVADETYFKVRGRKGFLWIIMDAVSRVILGYRASDDRSVGSCILAMRMAFRSFKERLPEKFRFIADGYSAYPLAAQQFFLRFGDTFKFDITQVFGLTNDDAVSARYRPYKQMVERLNRTFRSTYRVACGYDTYEGANYNVSLWVAYYNFLRPHAAFQNQVLIHIPEIASADNMPAKWQMLIHLGQQTILNLQKQPAA